MSETSYYGNSNASSQKPPAAMDQGKIFVGGLSWTTTEESLRYHFEQYGPVANVELMKDRVTQKPRGFGFVTFADAATVDIVVQHSHEVNHKIVDVKRAQRRGEAPPSIHENKQRPEPAAAVTNDSPEALHNKVFVGGIPPSIDRDALKTIFEQFGPVTDCIVMLDQETMRSRGFAFVTFENSEAASRSIDAQPLNIQGKHVEVKLATPREQQPSSQQHRNKSTPKVLGLRAGQTSSSGEFAGLAVAYGRSGWKAGMGSKAFGKWGWNVWDDGTDDAPERSGFSFQMLKMPRGGEPPKKRAKM